MTIVLVFAFVLTVIFTLLLKLAAKMVGLVDLPDERKQHKDAVPTVGGIAMFLALALSAIFLPDPPPFFNVFIGCSFALVLCGVLDDCISLSPRTRFIIQIFTGLAMVFLGHHAIRHLGPLFAEHPINLTESISSLFTVFCVVGVINAMNMVDGVDGLAGGIALEAFLWLAAIAMLAGLPHQASTLLLLAVVITGFLVFNMRHPWRKQAAVFMGDAGSTTLGFAFCWFAIDIAHAHTTTPVPPITAVWILGLPILDTLLVMTTRILQGKSPFLPGRDHLHHLLLKKGLSETAATWTMITLSFYFGLVGMGGWWCRVPDYYLFYGFIGMAAIYAALVAGLRKQLHIKAVNSRYVQH